MQASSYIHPHHLELLCLSQNITGLDAMIWD